MAADNRRLGAEKNLVQSSDSERMSSPSMTMELTSNEKPIFLGKSSSADIVRSSIDSPSFLAGYMDFDPMVAATRSHSNTHQRNRRSSWFNRSD